MALGPGRRGLLNHRPLLHLFFSNFFFSSSSSSCPIFPSCWSSLILSPSRFISLFALLTYLFTSSTLFTTFFAISTASPCFSSLPSSYLGYSSLRSSCFSFQSRSFLYALDRAAFAPTKEELHVWGSPLSSSSSPTAGSYSCSLDPGSTSTTTSSSFGSLGGGDGPEKMGLWVGGLGVVAPGGRLGVAAAGDGADATEAAPIAASPLAVIVQANVI